ncbi:O-antigen polymerase [Paraclostridium sp. AKS73]|uniref:O-antigen polymerase n=1 Tax=Paraclostridium sp. AKS73 TaxID=2876116 RepID=UPI0021E04A3B|nr:O-antigen polymerase [Paraclostridium sp. AKS73]MCU9816213.1 oligosaccharide repeat unit polymerase [Paraclostridium sp. AKS73]
MLTVINIGYSIAFVIIPILILNLDFSTNLDRGIISNVSFNNDKQFLSTLLLCALGYICIVAGFYYKNLVYFMLNKKNIKIDSEKYYSIDEKVVAISAIITFIISTASLCIYTIKLGGISNTLESAELYRMYGADQISGSFIKVFFPLIIASCNLYYILKIDNKSKNSYKIMFIITAIISLYYLLINAGRMPVFLFLATFIVFKILKDNKSRYIVPILIIGIIGVKYLDVLFGYLAYGSSFTGIKIVENKTLIDSVKDFAIEFSFPYINVFNVVKFAEGSFRFFIDYIMSVIQFLPDLIFFKLGFGSPVMLHEINTANHQVNAGIPVDVISYGYYQIGIIGLIIHTFLFGVISRFLNNLSTRKGNYIYIFLRAKLLILWGFNVMYSDIDTFIRGKLDLIIFIFIVLVFSKQYRLNERMIKK